MGQRDIEAGERRPAVDIDAGGRDRAPGKETRSQRRYRGGAPSATPVQAKGALQTEDAHAAAHRGVADAGSQLPYLESIQRAFGPHDVSGVVAHVGGAASEACEALGATGYATGNDVAFQAKPSLHTAAHEAAHVVQQRAGVQLQSGLGQTGDRYERHADAVADAVVAGESAVQLLDGFAGPTAGVSPGAAVQREDDPKPNKDTKKKEPELLTKFAGDFSAAADLIRKNPDGMKLVGEAAAAGVEYGGHAEDGPGKMAWPYTAGTKVYVPKARTDAIVAMSDFLFELNNAIRAPTFAKLDAEARKGSKGSLTAEEYAYKNTEQEVEGMLRMGEIWFKTKAGLGGEKKYDKYDTDFFLKQYEEHKAGKKSKDAIVKEVLDWPFGGGSGTHGEFYKKQYQELSGGK